MYVNGACLNSLLRHVCFFVVFPCWRVEVSIFVGAALISKQKLNDNYNDGNNSWSILFLSCLNSTKWSVLITSGGLRGSGKSSSVLLYNSPRWGIAVPHSWSSIILTKSKIIVVVVVFVVADQVRRSRTRHMAMSRRKHRHTCRDTKASGGPRHARDRSIKNKTPTQENEKVGPQLRFGEASGRDAAGTRD